MLYLYQTSRDKSSVMYYATYLQSINEVTRMSRSKLFVDQTSTALYRTLTKCGVSWAAKQLSSKEVDLPQQESGDTLLHRLAAGPGDQPKTLLRLAIKSANGVNVANIEGKTPLYIAIENDHWESAATFIALGAQANITIKKMVDAKIATLQENIRKCKQDAAWVIWDDRFAHDFDGAHQSAYEETLIEARPVQRKIDTWLEKVKRAGQGACDIIV
jgi:hypothetical protein